MKNWKKYVPAAFKSSTGIFADGPHEIRFAKELLVAALIQNASQEAYRSEICAYARKLLAEANTVKSEVSARIRATRRKLMSLDSYFEFDKTPSDNAV